MKRSRLAPIGKRGLRRQATVKAALAEFFKTHGWQDTDGTLLGNCQVCGEAMVGAWTHAHHKTLRSQGGTDDPTNLLACHAICHLLFLHDGAMGLPPTPWGQDRIRYASQDPANLTNGQRVSWTDQHKLDLASLKRRTA